MPNYRRYRVQGGIVFITAVTYDRRQIFWSPRARELLRRAIEDAQKARPWTMDGIVLIPDHIHMLWRLPPGDDDFSTRMQTLKKAFTEAWLAAGGQEAATTGSHRRFRRSKSTGRLRKYFVRRA